MKLLNTLIDFMGLELPVTVTIKTKRSSKKWDALYMPVYSNKSGLLKSHKIIICADAGREFRTLLAHELIHAWQEENKKTEIHGQHFQTMAEHLEDTFGIREIYLPELDK